MILIDLERRSGRYFALSHRIRWATYVKMVKGRSILSLQKCRVYPKESRFRHCMIHDRTRALLPKFSPKLTDPSCWPRNVILTLYIHEEASLITLCTHSLTTPARQRVIQDHNNSWAVANRRWVAFRLLLSHRSSILRRPTYFSQTASDAAEELNNRCDSDDKWMNK